MSGAASHRQLQCQSQKLSAGLSVSDQVTGRPTLVLGSGALSTALFQRKSSVGSMRFTRGQTATPVPPTCLFQNAVKGSPTAPGAPITFSGPYDCRHTHASGGHIRVLTNTWALTFLVTPPGEVDMNGPSPAGPKKVAPKLKEAAPHSREGAEAVPSQKPAAGRNALENSTWGK